MPVLPCPYCKKPYNFHEDELDGVADGSAVCLECGHETALNGIWMSVLSGELVVPREEDSDADTS